MTNKKILLAMLVIEFAFGMTVVGCDNSPEGDTWSNVTSLSQLDGTWNGWFTFTETEDGITVRTTVDATQTINASAKTVSASIIVTMEFSGARIVLFWPFIKEAFEDEDGVTINDSTRTITMTETINELLDDDAIAEMLDSGIQINQDGTKIKTPPMDGIPEIIMTKQ